MSTTRAPSLASIRASAAPRPDAPPLHPERIERTKDEVKDPHNLKLWCEVSGTMRQNGSTSTMIFKIPQLIAFISKHMTIYPGDIISTGTPPGVGSGIKPEPIYLKGGDVMKTGVEGLGEQKTKMTQDK